MTRVREFALPDLGEGLADGEILRWLVAVDDTVALNQPIVEVETAKAAVEIPAKWAGKVVAIHHEQGETVTVGTAIISIDTDPEAGPLPPADSAPADSAPAARGATPQSPDGRTAVLVGYGPRATNVRRRPRAPRPRAPRPRAARPPAAVTTGEHLPETPPDGSRPVLAKPPVRKLARDLDIDLTRLMGNGPAGSITRDDVLSAREARDQSTSALPTATGGERRIPVKGIQRLMADNMTASAFTAPHATELLTVDVTRSMRALGRLKQLPQWQDVRLSPLLLVAKGVLLAIRRYPLVNSCWAGEEIVVKEYVNLGIAAATERGLVVPNVKNANALSLRQLAVALHTLVTTAKAGHTPPADMAGGTLTITNVGVFGIDSGTPILPPGETAILALGAIRETPWVHHGEIQIRQVATLALSFDHRVIDGALAAHFLTAVGQFLSDPELALLAEQ